MDNSEVNRIRVEAFKKHGPVRIVRLRTEGGPVRFYLCKVNGERILSVLAGGLSAKEIIAQL